MIPTLLLNVLKTLILDSATDCAKKHIEEAIHRNLGGLERDDLDKLIDEDKSHKFKNLSEFLG